MLRLERNEAFLLVADESGRAKMKETVEAKHGIQDVITIGRSILGKEIDAYRIGEGRRLVCIFASHHALESITANLSFLIIDALLSNFKKGNVNGIDCKLLLAKYSFWIVPCVNPDGVELRCNGVGKTPLAERQMRMSGGDFSSWQANARGVDLNHNYNYRFKEYKVIEAERKIFAGATLYSGEYPESEPESRAVANLIRSAAPIAVVSLHAQGEEIFSYPRSPSVGRVTERLAALSGYCASVPLDTAAYGGLCDYTGSLGIPSFTYEVGRGKNPLPESSVYPIFERIAEGIILLPTFL